MVIPPAGDPEIIPRTPENSARNDGEQTLAPAHGGRTRRTQNITIPPLDFNVPDHTSNRITNQMVWALILSFKKTITPQIIAIESARPEIQEIEAGQEDLQKENTKLQEEIQSLRSQVEAQTLFTPKSWAANCVRISTAATLDDDIDNKRSTRFLPPKAANTYSKWSLHPGQAKEPKPKRAYNRADWAQVGQSILKQVGQDLKIETNEDLDRAVENLIRSTTAALNQHVPAQAPCPYSKRWFTPELKAQQVEVNRSRRRWQNGCAILGPDHPTTKSMF
ncbi:hypothetical protein CBS115989_10539 [Aspergillus niger]|nr:hypothetical protein CBS115989_10539 [Aspergillus niger]KAI2859507.1 hypothetical protein CBS11232_1968 [Aspergillus niger]KAI2870363.1 hypothetical protein CBS115988_9379 [Aspergillus niger]KAI2871370.1 hypothetical protein CBS11852_10986 [Aspergillus niger]KAI2919239.1 hypothetical protein CBS147320_8600 [Aspergillus niger]